MADGSPQLGYLGVTRSLSGRLWRERPADAELVRRHQLNHGLSEPLARALAARGVLADQGETYLNPTLKALFPDPSSFADMDRAAAILVDALERKRPLWCSPTTTWTAPRPPPSWCAGSARWGTSCRSMFPTRIPRGLWPVARRLPPVEGRGRGAGDHGRLRRGRPRCAGLRRRDRPGGGGDRPPPDARRGDPPRRGPGEPQPARLYVRTGASGRGRRHLRPVGGPEPRGPQAGPVRRSAGA